MSTVSVVIKSPSLIDQFEEMVKQVRNDFPDLMFDDEPRLFAEDMDGILGADTSKGGIEND